MSVLSKLPPPGTAYDEKPIEGGESELIATSEFPWEELYRETDGEAPEPKPDPRVNVGIYRLLDYILNARDGEGGTRRRALFAAVALVPGYVTGKRFATVAANEGISKQALAQGIDRFWKGMSEGGATYEPA